MCHAGALATNPKPHFRNPRLRGGINKKIRNMVVTEDEYSYVRLWYATTINMNLDNLLKDLQRVIFNAKKMGLHACVRLVSPQDEEEDEEEDAESNIPKGDILVIGSEENADALPAVCSVGYYAVDIIPINHLDRDLIARVLTLLLYHVSPDGALCSPGKDWEPMQYMQYNIQYTGHVLRDGKVTSLSTLLFDTMPSTPCDHYRITVDVVNGIRYKIKVNETSYISHHSISVSVSNTHTTEFYCSIDWDWHRGKPWEPYRVHGPRSCLDLQVGMQHVFEIGQTNDNDDDESLISKKYTYTRDTLRDMYVFLRCATNITMEECRRMLYYLLTTEEIVSPVVTDLHYGTMTDEIVFFEFFFWNFFFFFGIFLENRFWKTLLSIFRRGQAQSSSQKIPKKKNSKKCTDVVIQLFQSEDGSISCLNLAGEEVLSVPPNTNAQTFRHELAKINPLVYASPYVNLHLINERGEWLTQI